MAHNREVAGLWCNQILEQLSNYADGELTADEIKQVEAHLSGCQWCDQFGHEFGNFLGQLRDQPPPPTPEPEITRRLWHRLNDELASE